MRKCVACLMVIGFPLLCGCACAPSPPPPSIIQTPTIKVEVAPQKPFEWALNISAVKDRQQLSKEIQERAQAEKVDRACVSIMQEALLIKGAQVYTALAPVLQKYGLSENREMRVEIAYLSVPPQDVERVARNWRFQSHTKSVTDIVQYVLLDPDEANELTQRITREKLADLTPTPSQPCRFLDTQLGEMHRGIQRGIIKAWDITPGPSGTQFNPQIGSITYGWLLDLRAHVNPDSGILLNLKRSFNTPWDFSDGSGAPDVKDAQIKLGYGREAGVLPIQRPSPEIGVVEFDVQFALRPDQTVIFTRNDLVFERLGTNQKRQCLILAKVVPGAIRTLPAP